MTAWRPRWARLRPASVQHRGARQSASRDAPGSAPRDAHAVPVATQRVWRNPGEGPLQAVARGRGVEQGSWLSRGLGPGWPRRGPIPGPSPGRPDRGEPRGRPNGSRPRRPPVPLGAEPLRVLPSGYSPPGTPPDPRAPTLPVPPRCPRPPRSITRGAVSVAGSVHGRCGRLHPPARGGPPHGSRVRTAASSDQPWAREPTAERLRERDERCQPLPPAAATSRCHQPLRRG